ncbi:hypothetical protein LTR97_009347 [Elasticomyces elasticus]|uniref:Uncharacterized protein n=1 Tax=Elasticomyces elasticus TaxID=574655 RepID=A0AAN7WBF3_9PEZI|nr:hypothetical protein LTR97_009347 [Elasticomyces elasticus]
MAATHKHSRKSTGRIRPSKQAKKIQSKEDRKSKSSPPAKTFPFLDLPAELRNAIYEYNTLSSTAVLRPTPRGRLLSDSPLMRVSHQVRDEYTAALLLAAPTITAFARDLDLSHIVTFLNKLSDRELSVLPSNASTSDRQIMVKLELTPNGLPQFDMLDRWLVRCGHASKKGTNIKMSYTVYGTQVFLACPYTQRYNHHHSPSYSTAIGMQIAGTLGLPPRVGTPVGDVYVAQKAALRRMEKAGMGSGRVCQELKKIVIAMRAPQPLR